MAERAALLARMLRELTSRPPMPRVAAGDPGRISIL
jgi:hypothetical protein